MPEGQSIREVEPTKPLADAVREVFERRASHGPRKLILEMYRNKFDTLLMTLPKEQRDTIAIKIQRLFVMIGAAFAEYGSRFVDFVRNVLVLPMIWATKDFPTDKYYQLNLSGAQAWGEFALRTTKTATAERMNYRDHFWNAAAAGVPMWSIAGAVGVGTLEGAKVGALFSPAGAAVGAAAGAVGGAVLAGATSLFYKIKDTLLGPTVVYYGLYSFHATGITINRVEHTTPSVPFRSGSVLNT